MARVRTRTSTWLPNALHRAGYLERLLDADRVQPRLKGVVKEAVNKTQTHWTARHAVHVWDQLSRSQMDTLRHLLSHVYDAATDSYVPIKAWVNPKDTLRRLCAHGDSRWRATRARRSSTGLRLR